MSALDKIAPYYKALAAFLVPLLGSLGTALTASSDNGSEITGFEWVQAVSLALVAGGVVFGVPNKDPQARHQDESVQPPDDFTRRYEGGAFDSGLLIAVAAVVVIVAGLIFIAQAF
jgi:hypothetical protein